MCLNQLKEVYENTSFELNSVEKDAVFNGNPNDKTEVTLSGDPQQQIDSKGLVGESESAKLEMEVAKIINESSLDHEIEKKKSKKWT